MERQPKKLSANQPVWAIIFWGIILIFSPCLLADSQAEKKHIFFAPPSVEKPFLVKIEEISFAMGEVLSSADIIIKDAAKDKQVPYLILAEEGWPDGSIMVLEIGFQPSFDLEKRYVLEWNSGEKRQAREVPDINLQELKIIPGILLDKEPPSLTTYDLGDMYVRIAKKGDVYLYLYLIPVVGILFFLIYRKVKLKNQ